MGNLSSSRRSSANLKVERKSAEKGLPISMQKPKSSDHNSHLVFNGDDPEASI